MSRRECKNSKSSQERKILIVSEDSKSFPSYFCRFIEDKLDYRLDRGLSDRKSGKKLFRNIEKPLDQILVEIINIINPVKIVEFAQKQSKKYDKIYCVFDYLRNGPDQSYQQAMSYSSYQNIIKINSIPSYEIWLLLHFRYTTQLLDEKQVIKALQTEVRKQAKMDKFKYSKSEVKDDFFCLLDNKTEDAIRHAKLLEKENEITNLGLKNYSLSTKIHCLIEDCKNGFRY